MTTSLTPRSLFLRLAAVALLMSPVAAQTTTRVSVDSTGAQGDDESNESSVSADGRFIAFLSEASNLVLGDTNDQPDVFVHDRSTGQTSRVSLSSSGAQGNGSCRESLQITPDGRYVAFSSGSSNFLPGDRNDESDIFVHDRQTGQTTCVSVSSTGALGARESYRPAISADGRFVAFESRAYNLVTGDTNVNFDVFVHDRLTAQTTRVSVDSAGAEGLSFSTQASISADGRYVTFSSYAWNLVPGDTNGTADVFLHDRETGQTSRLSVDSAGIQGNGESFDGSISANGRYVAFQSVASNLVPGDTNNEDDIFVHDRLLGRTSRVSLASDGGQAAGGSGSPSISEDGSNVAFMSLAVNLVPGATVSGQIYIRQRLTGLTSHVSVNAAGLPANSWCNDPVISSSGHYLTFRSIATNLVAGDTNQCDDIFLRFRGAIGPYLTKIGACPGIIHLTVADATPGGLVAILLGPAGGDVKRGGLCDGLRTDVSAPVVVATLTTDSSGVAAYDYASPLSACGQTLQAVDLSTCVLSSTLVLDTRTVSLARLGFCDGMVNLTVREATPTKVVAIIYGAAGSFTKLGRPCAGLTLGISTPRMGALLTADLAGVVSYNFFAPARVCGMTVQAVDLTTCTVTEAVVLEPSGLTLSKSRGCSPFQTIGMVLTVTGAFPTSTVVLLQGSAGTYVKPGPPCSGVMLGITAPAYLAVLTADSLGSVSYSLSVPPALCGMTVQSVESTSCTVSNTITF